MFYLGLVLAVVIGVALGTVLPDGYDKDELL